jgi:hypothetical protein
VSVGGAGQSGSRSWRPALRAPAPPRPIGARVEPDHSRQVHCRPAPLVVGDRLYLYTGHDEAQRDEMFNMREWLAFSTTDMRTWTDHGPIMRVADFKWAKQDAWASQMIEKNGRFWFYAAVEHDNTHPGQGDRGRRVRQPHGPVRRRQGLGAHHQRDDAEGHAQLGGHRSDRVHRRRRDHVDRWGNRQCYIARLKPNMIELDGPITEITPPHFEEGPWLHKRGDLYYLTYASLDRSKHRDEKVS